MHLLKNRLEINSFEINKIEHKIPSSSGLVTNSALTPVEKKKKKILLIQVHLLKIRLQF